MYGLTLELYLGDPTYDLNTMTENGVFVSIHNQTDQPFSKNNAIKAPTGASTDLIIKKEFIKKLSPPFGRCMPEKVSSNLYNYIVSSLNLSYSREHCFSLCMQQEIKKKCGCVNAFLPTFVNDSTSFCYNETSIGCISDLANYFEKTASNAICEDSCPFECSTIEFEVKSYSGRFPSRAYTNILNNIFTSQGVILSENDSSNSVARVNIYYESMIYKITTEIPLYSPIDLIGILGGILGLCAGFSLLSTFEIFHLFFNIIHRIFNSLLTQKQIRRRVIPE
jgi:hypothetical protein